MALKIGSKYYETREKLREKIRDNTITALELESDKFGCYFCGKPINGKMRLLIEKYDIKGNEGEITYPIHESCYHQAKLFFYYNDIPFSIN